MPADNYEIGIIWKQINLAGRQQPPSEREIWSQEKLFNNIPLLIERNRQSFEIFIRPADDSYVLLDDVKRIMLTDIASILPCLLMETSPANYQIWLRIKNMPKNHAQQQMVWRALASRFNADPGSAKPGQLGRLPGFINQKPKYFPANPVVKLHKYANRYSTVDVEELLNSIPADFAFQPKPKRNSHYKKQSGDRSAFDFAICCSGIQRGFNDQQIGQYLIEKSEKARQRGKKYIEITIQKARNTVSTAKNTSK